NLETGLKSEVFSANFPLIGSKLKDAAHFVQDFRATVIPKLRGVANGTLVRQTLFDAFGPGGLKVLADGPDANTTVELEDVRMISDADHVQFDLRLRQDVALVA